MDGAVMDEEIIKAILKKATGYTYDEVVEEFAVKEGGEELIKRKITKKHYPPDSAALKAYMEFSQGNVCELSDEELQAEKQRLLKLLEGGQCNKPAD